MPHGGSVASGLSCSMPCGILVPQLGIEATVPALQGEFLTTGPLGNQPPRPFLLEWQPNIEVEHLKILGQLQRWASDCPQDKWIFLSWLSKPPVCSLHTHPQWEEATPHPGPRKCGWHPRRASIAARIRFRRSKAVVRVVIYNQRGGGTSLVVQWLPRCTSNAGDPGSIPGQGTRSHMLQVKSSHVPQLKD